MIGGNKKVKVINCAVCAKFCQNKDKESLENLIKKIREEGFKPVFSCDFLKSYFVKQ